LYRLSSFRTVRRSRACSSASVGGIATGAGRAVILGKMGVSGIIVLRDTGVVGVVSVGVFEEDRDAEGNETMRLAVLRFAKCI
jgi:hypothetical protein